MHAGGAVHRGRRGQRRRLVLDVERELKRSHVPRHRRSLLRSTISCLGRDHQCEVIGIRRRFQCEAQCACVSTAGLLGVEEDEGAQREALHLHVHHLLAGQEEGDEGVHVGGELADVVVLHGRGGVIVHDLHQRHARLDVHRVGQLRLLRRVLVLGRDVRRRSQVEQGHLEHKLLQRLSGLEDELVLPGDVAALEGGPERRVDSHRALVSRGVDGGQERGLEGHARLG